MLANSQNPYHVRVSRGGGSPKRFIKPKLECNKHVNSKTYQKSKLKKCFPQFFDKNGNFNFSKFKFALAEENIPYFDNEFSQRESYSLNFAEKKFTQIKYGQASVIAVTPDLECNNKPENIDSIAKIKKENI